MRNCLTTFTCIFEIGAVQRNATSCHKFVVWEGLASSTLVPSWVMCKQYSPLSSWTGPPPLELSFVTELRVFVGSCGVLRPGHALKKRLFVWGPRGGFPWFFPLRLQRAKVWESQWKITTKNLPVSQKQETLRRPIKGVASVAKRNANLVDLEIPCKMSLWSLS